MSYHMFFFNNTIILQVRYIIIEAKEVARNGNSGFLFPHLYSGNLISHPGEKPVLSNTGNFFCFNNNVYYTLVFVHRYFPHFFISKPYIEFIF